MATKKRTYHDLCGLSHALELVGERWAILVLRELAYGPKRFTDIRSGLPSAQPERPVAAPSRARGPRHRQPQDPSAARGFEGV